MQWLPKANKVLASAENTSAVLRGGCCAASRLRPVFRLTPTMNIAVKVVVKSVKSENRRMLRMEGTSTISIVIEPMKKAQDLQQEPQQQSSCHQSAVTRAHFPIGMV